ncbi:rhodanese-like domain-containing protein [Nitrospirota bacterium]
MIRRFTTLSCIVLLLLVAMPSMVLAGPSIDTVKKNVVKIWKPVKENQPSVQVQTLKKIIDSDRTIVLLDVRTTKEYEAAHLPGAINITRGLVEWEAPKMIKNTDAKIFVYCRTGARSAMVTRRLTKMGYMNVKNVYSGFKGWVLEGYPVYNMHGKFKLTPKGFEKPEPE